MLNAIVEASLRYKVLVVVGFLVMVGLGVMAFRQVPVDAFPDVTPAQVNIYTESPGVAAEDIERLLTVPIEGAMAGLANVQVVRSVSLFGLSYVGVYFSIGSSLLSRIEAVKKTSPVAWLVRSFRRSRAACRRATGSRNSDPTAPAWARSSGTPSRTPTRS